MIYRQGPGIYRQMSVDRERESERERERREREGERERERQRESNGDILEKLRGAFLEMNGNFSDTQSRGASATPWEPTPPG